jgi:RNA polymerase sigma-70 factor (ECF subfamily)
MVATSEQGAITEFRGLLRRTNRRRHSGTVSISRTLNRHWSSMREPHSEGLNLMNTTVISENSFGAGWGGRPQAAGGFGSIELVKPFGDRIYSIAKHITQNDDAAEHVLIDTFLKVCSDLDGYQGREELWLRLVTIAVKEAFSKLYNRSEDSRHLDPVVDSDEELVVRELSVWRDDYLERYSRKRTTSVLEHGIASLDPMCRTVFLLRDIEEISVGHIAKIVNRSVAAVEVCLLRARLQLRDMLTRQMRQLRVV